MTTPAAVTTSKPHSIGAVRPEDFLELYTPKDEEHEKLYKKLLAEKMQEKDPKSGKYLRPWTFEVAPGIFKQSDETTDPFSFDYITDDFGVKKSWKEIVQEVNELNEKSGKDVSYKVLFLARHGQGWHNFSMAKYGYDDWEVKWSRLNGDDELTWGPDPFLTPLGVQQAKDNHTAWKKQIEKGAPIPDAFYASPFTRSIETLINTWSGITEFKPLIKEDLRETIGVHTCDKRSPRSVIEDRFTKHNFTIEDGFPEEDTLYTDDYRETIYEQSLRVNNFLNFLFEKDFDSDKKDQFVNVTSHSGTIRSFIMALDHRKFAIGTGGMIPVFIKATRRTDDL